jgi:Sugar (and other) transporter
MNTAFAAGTFLLPAGPLGIERIGRRNVMLYSAIILTFCLLIFTTMINLDHKTIATQWTGVAFIVIYNFVFGWGWIGVPWLYGPEVRSPSLVFRTAPSSLPRSSSPRLLVSSTPFFLHHPPN